MNREFYETTFFFNYYNFDILALILPTVLMRFMPKLCGISLKVSYLSYILLKHYNHREDRFKKSDLTKIT